MPRSRNSSRWLIGTLASVALCTGLALTAIGVSWTEKRIQANAQIRFDNHAARVEDAVKRRFGRPLSGFHGIRSFIEANDSQVSRRPFGAWMASRDMEAEFPGVRGIGFIERVSREGLARFIASERADHAPDFNVYGDKGRPDLYVIKYIEPLAASQRARGFDVGAEPVRRQAVERAVASGQATLSGPITLMQADRAGPGMLYLLPVYRKVNGQAPNTPPQRQDALVGLVYAPLVLSELMRGVDQAADQQLDFELFDGDARPDKVPLYDHDGQRACMDSSLASSGCTPHAFHASRTFEIGGRLLGLSLSSTPAFDATVDHHAPRWVALAGGLLSSLLCAIIWLLGMGSTRAMELARRMTLDLSQAKLQAETALRDTSALLATLNQHAIVSVADRAGCITEANDAFCRISGIRREELIGQNHRIVNSGVQGAEFWKQMWRAIASGTPWRGTVCNRARDGSLYWVDTFIAPFMDGDGKIAKYISISTDVTAARNAEIAMQKQTVRYGLAIEGGTDGLWDWMDVSRDEEWWSPQFYRLLGYEPDEIVAGAQAFMRLVHPGQHHLIARAVAHAFNHKTPIDLECALRQRCGEYRWFHARAKVYCDEAGQPVRMAGSLQDVHEQRLAQEQVRAHSHQLDAIFSLSPDGFASFDADCRVSLVSPAFTHLTGLRADELLGLDEATFVARLMAHCSETGRISGLDELRTPAEGKRSDAEGRITLQWQAPIKRVLQATLFTSNHKEISQVLHLRDVTHETEVDRMKSEFLSMAAHELRTPMTSIYGFTELLLQREMPVSKQKHMLGRIRHHSLTITSMLNELLDLAHIEARRNNSFALELCDLGALAREIAQEFQPPDGRAAPELHLPPQASWVMTERSKLQRAVQNLLSNAYKYSPEGGAIRMEVIHSRRDNQAWNGLRITDHGIGLSDEALQRVGERFFRAEKSGHIPGTGLGVSIVKETIELMGGRMEFRSREGHGTQVSLWLPMASAPAQDDPVSTPREPAMLDGPTPR